MIGDNVNCIDDGYNAENQKQGFGNAIVDKCHGVVELIQNIEYDHHQRKYDSPMGEYVAEIEFHGPS